MPTKHQILRYILAALLFIVQNGPQALRFLRHHYKWIVVLIVALANDIFDYMGGALPIFNILDVATAAVLYPVIGLPKATISLVELIPGVDFLPVHTTLVLIALWQAWKRGDLETPVEDVEPKQILPGH